MAERFTDFSVEYELDEVNAQEDATITAVGNNQYVADISTILGLNTFPNIITQEKNHSILDGRCTEYNPNSDTVGYYSFYDSDANGEFSTNPKLTATFTSYHSSYALTIGFTDCSPLEIKVTWYHGSTKLFSMVHEPENRDPIVYITQAVESYNKIVIEILKTLPYHNVKIGYLQFGTNLIWNANDIKSGKIVRGLNRLADKLSIDTLKLELIDKDNKFNFNNPNGMFKLFKPNQGIYPYGVIEGHKFSLGKFFLNSVTTNKGLATIDAVSYMGVLDSIPFNEGAIYNGTTAKTIIDKIFSVANVTNYSIDSITQNQRLYGTIRPMSCAKALQAVLFACRSIIDTASSDGIIIKKAHYAIVDTISRSNKFSTAVTSTPVVSGVELKFTSFMAKSSDTKIASDLYPAGENTVVFAKPYRNITVSTGTIIKQSNFYVIFSLSEPSEVEIRGYGYDEEVNKLTANTDLGNDINENIKSYTTTLCNAATAQTVLNSLLEYYKNQLQLKIKQLVVPGDNYDTFSLDNLHSVDNTTPLFPGFIAMYEERNFDLTGSFVDDATLLGYFDTTDMFYYTGTELYGNDDFII